MGVAVLEYLPEKDESRLAMAHLLRFSFGDIDTEFVSDEEFEAFVAKQRDEIRKRRGILLPDEVNG
jgi:hypothetical protein